MEDLPFAVCLGSVGYVLLINFTMCRATVPLLPKNWEMPRRECDVLPSILCGTSQYTACTGSQSRPISNATPTYAKTTRNEAVSKNVPLVGLDDKRQITAVWQAATGVVFAPQ